MKCGGIQLLNLIMLNLNIIARTNRTSTELNEPANVSFSDTRKKKAFDIKSVKMFVRSLKCFTLHVVL